MKVMVLGAGVIGVTTAHYLAEAGHEVTVVDRRDQAAEETSYANAGEVSPGYASPWAAPGVPTKALRWIFMRHAPLILNPVFDPATFSWLLGTLRNCTAARYALNKGRMVRLAEFSRDELVALRQSTGINYEHRSRGTVQLFRKPRQMDAAASDMAVLESYGIPFELLDREGCIAAEPGLKDARDRFIGGLRLPNDETGDCRLFTRRLAARLKDQGVEFLHGVTVKALEKEGDRIVSVRTDKGALTADAYVLATASHSPALARPLGLRLPIYPVKGYSITVPVADPDKAPVSTLLDETYKIAVTRLGDRIRVGGMAEIAGFDHTLPERRRATLFHTLNDLFPGAAGEGDPDFWCGLRPMTPDSTPIVGPTRIANLWLNTGHGTLGWTMACGSGRLVASQISGGPSPIDPEGLDISRYG